MFRKNSTVQKIVAIWREWHLNDMQASSPAQTEVLKRRKAEFPCYPKSYYEWAKDVLTEEGVQPDNSYIHEGKPYSYGSAWLKKELPQDVIDYLESL
jgi:hypothetical protein